jgi:hypothetical protein
LRGGKTVSSESVEFFVNMHDGIHNHYTVNESPFAAEGVNWPATMDALGDKYCRQRPTAYRLEINSHGEPATICLQPKVGFQNLPQFAQAARRLVRPNGFIEILSCWVASFNFWALAEAVRPTYRPATMKAVQAYGKDRIAQLRQENSGQRITTNVDAQTLLRAVYEAIRTNDDFLLGTRGPETPPPYQAGTREYRQTANGPLFCTRLASLTQCRVRAAMIPQLEEGEKSGNAQFSTPIGDWEGHVLDFMPSGEVRYAGFNLPRPVFRTHDQYGDGPLRVS